MPTQYGNKIIMTTNQVAEYYNVEPHIITQNFSNNKKQFQLGRDYFLLKGNELKAFKNDLENFYVVGKDASHLYLWTEFGVLLHAKSINTQEAWDKYFTLVDTYFRATQKVERQVKMLNYLDESVATVKEIRKAYKCPEDTILDYMKYGLKPKEDYDGLMGEELRILKEDNILSENMSHVFVIYPSGLKKIERHLEKRGYKLALENPKEVLLIK